MSHIIDVEKTLPFTCEDCKHFHEGIKCAAFDIIPIEIYDNAESHKSVVEGQHGDYVFSATKDRQTLHSYELGD